VTPFEGVAGHEQAIRLLRSQLESGRLSHAYLFVGEPGLGKTTVGRRLARALLPEVPLDRHPDYWEDDRIKGIRIDEIRLIPEKSGPEAHDHTLQQFINLKPGIGRYRVALISNVGRLADPVQGVLLKTLEEPHPNRVIILTTPSLSPFVVLPTVASRCQRIAFQPVAAHEIERLLLDRDVDPRRAAVLAQLARGRPGWALAAAHDESVVERHREWSQRLDQLFGAPADVALAMAAELDSAQLAWRNGERDSEDPVLFALGSWQLGLRRRMLEDVHPGRWAMLLEQSYDTLGYLEQNVSPRLALECFLLECRKAS
jgi:DNA polymerase-3 subunit delta'